MDTLLNRGELLVMAGRWDHALWDFSCAVALDSTCVAAYINRGERTTHGAAGFAHVVHRRVVPGALYAQLQETSKALVDFRHALSLSPHSAPALLNAAMSYHLLGDFDQAYTTYLAAQVCRPIQNSLQAAAFSPRCLQRVCDDARVTRNLGAALLCMGRPVEGESRTHRLCSCVSMTTRGACCTAIEELTKAALTSHTADVGLHCGIATATVEAGHVFEGIKLFSGALDLDPRSAMAYVGRGYVLSVA